MYERRKGQERENGEKTRDRHAAAKAILMPGPNVGRPTTCSHATDRFVARASNYVTDHALRIEVEGSSMGIPFSPATGHVVIFPAWLEHRVEPYVGTGERISIAFNAVNP